jgi:hypothetical protein
MLKCNVLGGVARSALVPTLNSRAALVVWRPPDSMRASLHVLRKSHLTAG